MKIMMHSLLGTYDDVIISGTWREVVNTQLMNELITREDTVLHRNEAPCRTNRTRRCARPTSAEVPPAGGLSCDQQLNTLLKLHIPFPET